MSPDPRPAWLRNLPSAEVRDLDPRLPALIEASAGTGKTFAVEHLVLRLLMENPDWLPEEILLLSFTEKTAADLRARIRALWHRQTRRPDAAGDERPIPGWTDDERARLHLLWTHADDLAVHTLHGFCQSSLRRDPLAADVLIRDEVADDRAVAEEALENLLRGPWARDPARLADLRDALDISGKDDWRRKLIRIALDWQPWRGDRLDPERDPGTLEPLEREAAEASAELRALASRIERGAFTISGFRGSFKPTKTGQVELNRNFYHKLFELLDGDPAPADVVAFFKGIRSNAAILSRGWESGLPDAALSLPEWRRLAEVCARLRPLSLEIGEARRLKKLGVLAEAARELRGELGREKIRRGVISYDDMPANLVRALRRNEDLAARIRRRYKACIVDEFQDTDPVQWEILETLCLRDGRAPLPLFLVGDPKQAIYGFRGGDLRTYLAARAVFRDRAAAGRAQGFGLEANFRSRRTVIEALNATFARPEWFGATEGSPPDPAWRLPAGSEHVSFTPARVGRADDGPPGPRVHLAEFADLAGPAPGKPPRKAEVERAVRRWIAARIVGLLEGETPARQAGDIAVLVRKNSEGEAMERLLRRCGVRCRMRRRGGIASGAPADALRLMLEWIDDAASPDAQARLLLLPFARGDADELPRGRPERTPPLLARWIAFARAGRWPEFFESVRRDGGYRDRLAAASPSEAERFDRLTRTLAEAGSLRGTSARALCEHFDALRRGEGAGGGGAESAEGDGDGAVSILTLHMSKGLEFPVVFLDAAGEGVAADHYVLRPAGEAGFRIVLDKKDPDAKKAHDAQEQGEEQRLFYVAFTRAKDELHIPLLPAKFAKGSAGPLGGFAAEALRAVAGDAAAASLFRWDTDPVDVRPLPAGAAREDGSARPDRSALLGLSRETFGRKRGLTSYSTLASQEKPVRGPAPEAAATPADDLIGDDGTRMLREEPPAPDSSEAASEPATPVPQAGITADELPPGAASGTALHALLEHTVFSSAREAADPEAWLAGPGQRARVEEALRRESVDPAHAPAAARAVWNALRAPLPDPAGGPAFRLSDLEDVNEYRHEVEFLFPFGPGGSADGLPEGVARRGSFLWGFIDLVFRHEGRYYLLDWKSNLLAGYDDASVRRSMESHRYDLQWKLYAVALHRWLRARLPEYDPTRHFGGVHYLYLRGATPDRFSGFTARPDARALEETFPGEIARLLGARAGDAP